LFVVDNTAAESYDFMRNIRLTEGWKDSEFWVTRMRRNCWSFHAFAAYKRIWF